MPVVERTHRALTIIRPCCCGKSATGVAEAQRTRRLGSFGRLISRPQPGLRHCEIALDIGPDRLDVAKAQLVWLRREREEQGNVG